MGLFGLKAKTVSQARAGGVFAGLDEDDDLDVPVTSSVASRCSHVSSSAALLESDIWLLYDALRDRLVDIDSETWNLGGNFGHDFSPLW